MPLIVPCSVLEGHTGWVNDVAVTNNGRRAVTASGDGTARLWETRRWVPDCAL
jgi:WD40 repeat protein